MPAKSERATRTLDGMEMDEDTIRSQQMLEQVSNLVKENPDSAASLVKRWLNRAHKQRLFTAETPRDRREEKEMKRCCSQ